MELVFDADDYDEATCPGRTGSSIPILPPSVLVQCFSYLPVSSLPAVALACRRLKVLVYSDAVWESKMQRMGLGSAPKKSPGSIPDSGNGSSLLDDPIESLPSFPVHRSNMVEATKSTLATVRTSHEQLVLGSSSSASSIWGHQIAGVPGDPYAMVHDRKETQNTRDRFKIIYLELWPYYVDFRQTNRDSKVIQEFGKDVLEAAKMLARLLQFSKANLCEDAETINSNLQGTCEYFENRCLLQFEIAYDIGDIPEMMKYSGVLMDLNGAVACIQIFIEKNSIFYDNAYEAIENLKQYEVWQAQPIVVRENMAYPEFTPLRLFMENTEMELLRQSKVIHGVFPEEADVMFTLTERVFEDVISEYCTQLFDLCSMRDKLLYLKSVPTAYRYLEHMVDQLIRMEFEPLPRYRIDKLLARVFASWLEQYLKQELDWVQKSFKDQIDRYNKQRDLNKTKPVRMNLRNREIFKRNFMNGFRKVLMVPYKISSSIVAGVTYSGTSTPPVAPSTPTPTSKPKRFSLLSISSNSINQKDGTVSSPQSTPGTPATPSTPTFVPEQKSTNGAGGDANGAGTSGTDADSIQSAPEAATAEMMEEQEEMNTLLSVELALHLIHLDKDALQRLSAFAGLGGVLGGRVQKTLESVFISLLRSIGQHHIKPGFATAIEQLGRYKPTTELGGSVSPLMDFFELVHVADLMLQMIHVYYAEEMCKYIDRMDFLNDANKEKKAFERMLDDGVASGLDKSIEVLINQVQYIVSTMQLPSDFNPEEGADIELQATKACREAVACLTTHTKMLLGCTDKHTLDVFYQEIGLRLFNLLTKHLRSYPVSAQGGFVLICDLNHYYNFIMTLKQPVITPNFLALKELGNIFIIQEPADLKQLVHDMERFGGILRVEDILEFAEMRTDWKSIQRLVERDRLECNIM